MNEHQSLQAPEKSLAFFTICSKNFTAYAKTLFESVASNHPDASLYLFLCDGVDSGYDPSSLPFTVVTLEQLQIPKIEEMANRYNITEFNTAIKPNAFLYLFNRLEKHQVVYLDPDILLTSPLLEVIEAFEKGAECILTPHILQPAENVEVHDQKMLQFGIYNLGFIALRKSETVIGVAEWWARRLERDCIIKLEDGLFVDQKWADLLPAFIPRTSILHHPGYNVAYWNLAQRTIQKKEELWLANDQPLRFVHFSGNKLDDEDIFSRHAVSFNRHNIGGLADLLDYYRATVYSHGHAHYSKLPYSYSWLGTSGINLHTPMPVHEKQKANEYALSSYTARSGHFFQRVKSGAKLANTAARMAGGWPSLVKKGAMALKRGGLPAIQHRIHLVRSYQQVLPLPGKVKTGTVNPSALAWAPRILLIDWSTPRPDRDAGSVTAFYLLETYVNLGYDVTFIPSDLQYLGEYTESLKSLGITCLHQSDIGSVKDHLRSPESNYDFVLLSRAPIAGLYIDDIRKFLPKAKIILNTSDLHYLRDIREAEISGDADKSSKAQKAKEWELDIIRRCDLTIVMSSVEQGILKTELPDCEVRLIPLMFVEIAPDNPRYECRKDFLFIGGFPHTPNVDSVLYFCKEILPYVQEQLPDVKFHIVGNAPPPQVEALAELPNVVVHGHVKDISTIFKQVRLSVAPLRYGAGIKGKIGTSLSFGVPVVATSIAAEGMEIEHDKHVLVADSPRDFAQAVVNIYSSEVLWKKISDGGRNQMLEVYSPVAGHRRISKLMQELNPQHKQLDLHVASSYLDYQLIRQAIGRDIERRAETELAIVQHNHASFLTDGFCAVCGKNSKFNTSFMYSTENTADGKPIPNWREHLDCLACGFTNRIRLSLHIFYGWIRPETNSSIYITEQSTALYQWLKDRHPSLVGSEYFNDLPLGTYQEGIRNEDLTALTFSDGAFDHVLSFDVMEHVSNDISAMREVYRCLKPGGTFLFTAPFCKDRQEKLIRAQVTSDGALDHIMPPEYHGNPVDPENGALCFRYFAWDLIEDLKSAGFKEAKILSCWSLDFAYLGGEQFIFLARK